jgi:hypothetical protein
MQMSEYRVYVIGLDGHFIKAIQLDSPADKAAMESASVSSTGSTLSFGKTTG